MSEQARRARTEDRTTTDPLLQVRGLKKHFDQSNGLWDQLFGSSDSVRALDGVSFDLYPGETMAIVGESGCGKSTLGKTILNLHKATDGEVRFRDEVISGLSDKQMRPYRRKMQMIYQDPLASLNPRQSIEHALLAPMEVHDILDTRDERLERARELLRKVGLQADYLSRYPHEFSGGQQQRIGIARALTMEPDLLIADEPTSALDVSVQAQIVNLLQDLQSEFGLSMIFITHDLAVVQHVADRVGVMYLGELVETAPTTELYTDPQHPYTASLLSAIPRIGAHDRTDRIILKGAVPSPSDPPSGCRFHTRCPVVIPPESWEGTQDAFVTGFRYFKAVETDKIDIEDIETRLKIEDRAQDTENLASYIRAHYFEDGLDQYPTRVRDVIVESSEAVARGDNAEAIGLLSGVFGSPCESSVPEPTDDHLTRCHRIGPDAKAEPIHTDR